MSVFNSSKYVERFDTQQKQNETNQASIEAGQTSNVQTTKTEEVKDNDVLDENKNVAQENVETSQTKVEDDKAWYEKEDYSVELKHNKDVLDLDNLKNILSDYERKIKEIEGDPLIATIIEAKKSGKQVTEVLKDIVGEDYDKMSPEELYRIDLKNKGFSDEEIKEAMEIFDEKSNIQKKLEVISIRENLKNAQREKLSKLQSNFQPTERVQVESKAEINFRKAQLDMDALSKLEGKEYLGVTLTKDIIDKVKDAINNKYVIGDAENGFDIQSSFDHHFRAIYTPLIVKANIQKAKTEAKEGILKEITRPDKNISERAGDETIKEDRSEIMDSIKKIWNV